MEPTDPVNHTVVIGTCSVINGGTHYRMTGTYSPPNFDFSLTIEASNGNGGWNDVTATLCPSPSFVAPDENLLPGMWSVEIGGYDNWSANDYRLTVNYSMASDVKLHTKY